MYLKTFSSFKELIRHQLRAFSQEVPGFQYQDLPIYGIISLGRTLGELREHNRKPILTFGIDQFFKTKEADLAILFAHEAFHAYHQQINPTFRSSIKKRQKALLIAAYLEGIATFASGYLNPKK